MQSRLKYYTNAALVCLMDCLFLNLAIWLSGVLFTYLLKANSPILSIYYTALPVMTAGCFVIFFVLGVYKSLWDFISLIDLIKLVVAVFLASFFAYVSLRIYSGYWQNPIIAVTTFYLFLTLAAGIRLAPTLWRMLKAQAHHQGSAQKLPILIAGAGDAADALIKDIKNGDRPYRVMALTDDDIKKRGHKLRGVEIMGTSGDIPALVKKLSIQEIIIAIPSATTAQRQKLIAATLKTGCKVRSMARIAELSTPSVADLHDLDVGDLLGRPEVQLDPAAMEGYITDKTVLVTGGGGSIGSELCRQLMRHAPRSLVIFDIYENNAYNLLQELRIIYGEKAEAIHVRVGSVQDVHRLDDVFFEFSPSVVFHAAAYKHVPLMEECPRLAIENNIFGTYNVAQAAIKHKARRFVLISTDKAVRPANVMGASKRIAEMLVHSLNGQGTEFAAVRFGNVLGSNGSVVPIFRRQIEMGGPVTVTHQDIIRYFMTIPEAAQLVLQAGAMAKGGETFVLDMGEPVKIAELARTMIEIAGLAPDKDIRIQYTGLRPGEKLYEELLLDTEGMEKTASNKIFIAHVNTFGAMERERTLSMLKTCVDGNDDPRACICAIVPDYAPAQHSSAVVTKTTVG